MVSHPLLSRDLISWSPPSFQTFGGIFVADGFAVALRPSVVLVPFSTSHKPWAGNEFLSFLGESFIHGLLFPHNICCLVSLALSQEKESFLTLV